MPIDASSLQQEVNDSSEADEEEVTDSNEDESDSSPSPAPSTNGDSSSNAEDDSEGDKLPDPTPDPVLQVILNSEGQSAFIVNLRTEYNEDLLLKFYRDLMIPNFPIESELEPLENFLVSLKRPSQDSDLDFDVLLLLDAPMRSPVSVTDEEGPVYVTSTSELPTILGGCVFEYYPRVNVGLISYIAIHEAARGKGFSTQLFQQSAHRLDQNARDRGNLAGCDAIFLETHSAANSSIKDSMKPVHRQRVLHKLGCRLLDLEYYGAPLSPSSGSQDFLVLTILSAAPHNGRILRDANVPYVPSAVVHHFLREQWRIAYEVGQTTVEEEDLTGDELDEALREHYPTYAKMMFQVEAREKIAILSGLPWIGARSFTMVDLSADFSMEYLVQFYKDFFLSGLEPDPEPLENWIRYLSPDAKQAVHSSKFHILLAVDIHHSGPDSIIGGVVARYFTISNCGLITYFHVRPSHHGKGVSKLLISDMVRTFDRDAKLRGHLAGCSAVFLETDVFSSPTDPIQEKQHTTSLHSFLYGRGFRQVDFDFFTTPYSKDDYAKPVILCAMITPRIPNLATVKDRVLKAIASDTKSRSKRSSSNQKGDASREQRIRDQYLPNDGDDDHVSTPTIVDPKIHSHVLPSSLMRKFITVDWKNAVEWGNVAAPAKDDRHFRYMLRQVQSQPYIPILSQRPPWMRRGRRRSRTPASKL
eukprot:CAMPEP_0177680200 /NCGR_PEP_ID=MMETSP0447-20121125/30039_1 /TAXON_ID=0 /ORGANISM="Stygamoeba regulata, Strain BSH-02190019" /LENGTH=699 /DNA_ID=CAMNT_0019189501 /DNA_START=126 /DNA_END=2225 /DNA_ORIENTATION=-